MGALTRRSALAGAAVALARPAIAQIRTVKFTLPWLAQGSSIHLYAGKQKGIFAKYGIDIDISRGFGSLAAGQAVAAGQFEFGTMISPPMILLVAKGLPLMALAIVSYDAGMGVGVLGDSPITEPKMLAGKKIGDVPASAEFPFFPAYAKMAGFPTEGIQFVNTDAKVLERVLSEKQIDAMTGIASSSLPIFMSKNIPVRWMLYSSVGVPSYGSAIIATQATLAKDPGVCAAMVDAICESLKFALVNPDEATALFLKSLPEMGLNPGAKEFLRIGMGLNDYAVAKPDAKQFGLGHGNPATLAAMADLVMQYAASPDMKRPEVDAFYKPDLGGKVTLSAAEWTSVDARVAEFGQYLT
jgi:ABC-type nitrate/sulfonate/bicarbonate transport system substrate-binding protein